MNTKNSKNVVETNHLNVMINNVQLHLPIVQPDYHAKQKDKYFAQIVLALIAFFNVKFLINVVVVMFYAQINHADLQ